MSALYADSHEISNLSVKAHASGSTGAAFNLEDTNAWYIHDIEFLSNGTGNWTDGFYLHAATLCWNNHLSHIIVKSQSGPATIVHGYDTGVADQANLNFADHFLIEGNTGVTKVFDVGGTRLFHIRDSMIEGNTGAVVLIPGEGTSMEGCWLEANAIPPIVPEAGHNFPPTSVVLRNNFVTSGGAVTLASYCTNWQIADNYWSGTFVDNGSFNNIEQGNRAYNAKIATDFRAPAFWGGPVVTDTTALPVVIAAQSAWSQATSQVTGANTNISGGLGRRFFAIVSNTALATKTVTITANGTLVTLTACASGEGCPGANQFGPVGTDDTAPQLFVTATALAAAITTDATLGPLITPTVLAAKVYLDKKPNLSTLVIASGTAGALVTAMSGADGVTAVLGTMQATAGSGATAGYGFAGGGNYGVRRNSGNIHIGTTSRPTQFTFDDSYFGMMTPAGAAGWYLSSPSAGVMVFGLPDAASPPAKLLRAQGVVAGTADTAGQPFTFAGSASTGSGAGGPLVRQTTYPGAASTAQNTVSTREFIASGWTTLTESSDTAIATLAYGESTAIGAKFLVTIEAADATDRQSMSYEVQVNTVRKTTGNTVTLVGVLGKPPAVASTSSATLSCTFTTTDAASAVTLNANCASSLTQTLLRATWQAIANGGNGVVGLVISQNY